MILIIVEVNQLSPKESYKITKGTDSPTSTADGEIQALFRLTEFLQIAPSLRTSFPLTKSSTIGEVHIAFGALKLL